MPLLLAWLIHGVVLAATIYGVLRLTRGPSAAMRYAVYWSALIVVLALPLASRARVPSFLPLPSLPFLSMSSPLDDARGAVSAVGADQSPLSSSPQAVTQPRDAQSGATTAMAASTAATTPAASQWSWPVVQLPRLPDWLVAIAIGLWLGTVLLALLRIALGIDAIQRLKQSCRPFPAARARRLTGWHDARRRGRLVDLCLCDDVASASFLGLTRPVIAISPALAATLSDEELDLTVLHEFAHVQRRDDWTKLVQLGVMAICGWHPAVRLLDRAIDLERESACDDWVVRATGAPRSYARCLVKIAETMPRATAALVPGAHASEAPMETRIKRLLDRGRARGAWAPLPAAATAVVMAMLALVITHASPLPLIVRTAAPARPIDVARHDASGTSGLARDDAARTSSVAPALPRNASRGDDVDVPLRPDASLTMPGATERADTQAALAAAAAAEGQLLAGNVGADGQPTVVAPRASGADRAPRPASAQTPSFLMASMFPSLRQQRPAQLTARDAQPRNASASVVAEPSDHEPGERANSWMSAGSTPVPASALPQAQAQTQTDTQTQASAQRTPAAFAPTSTASTSAAASGAIAPPLHQTPASPVGLSAANNGVAEPRVGKNAIADDGDGRDRSSRGSAETSDGGTAPNDDDRRSWGAGAVAGGVKTAGVAAGDGVWTAGLATGDGVKTASVATGGGLKDAGAATGSGLRIASAATGKATSTAAAKTGDGLKKAGIETAHALSRAKRAFGSIF
jgi:beta-lactamase regulating signal transducer with metallopeptidase domain